MIERLVLLLFSVCAFTSDFKFCISSLSFPLLSSTTSYQNPPTTTTNQQPLPIASTIDVLNVLKP